MKKVTKRLLVAFVAALAVGGCQDSPVFNVPPAPEPPPPPPPPPTVEATVTIQGLRSIPGGTPVNPTMLFGDINVVLNVEENDETVADIDLLVNGNPIGCQGLSGNRVPGDGVRLSQGGGADTVECFFNTDDVQGACVGTQLDAAFPNGQHTLGARITTSDGNTREATNEAQITLVNSDFLLLVHNEGSKQVVSGGVLYYGGPAGTDNLNSFAVCPVSYQGTTVASLGLQAITGAAGQNSLDLKTSGAVSPGGTVTDATSPFVWAVDPTRNDLFGSVVNPVEDDVTTNGLGAGHTVSTAGTIFDSNGLNVTSQFTGASLGPIFFDFTAPRPDNNGAGPASDITIGGASAIPGTWYSAGSFGLSNVIENGVGWSFGAGAQVDVGDCQVAANNDDATFAGTGGDPATAFVTVVANATGMPDHPEDDWENSGNGFGAADAGGLGCYLAELQALADDLMNAYDLSLGAPLTGRTIQNVTGDVAVADGDFDSYGADFTGPGLTNAEPAASVTVLNPDMDSSRPSAGAAPVLEGTLTAESCADPTTATFVGDCQLRFDGADLVLASGDPGSGIDEAGCGGAGPCTNVTAEITSGPNTATTGDDLGIDNQGTNSTDKMVGGNADFLVDMGFGAPLPGTTFPLPDGPYTIEIDADDLASPANTTVLTYTFTLDDTSPVFGALNPAPVGSAGTDAAAIVMTIGGTITDANIIDDAELEVFVDGTDNIGTGANGACDSATDFKLSVSAGDIDRNDIDHENGTNSITFNETFTINQPDTAARTLNYCFIHKAEDEAVLGDGTDRGNRSSLRTLVTVTWNAG